MSLSSSVSVVEEEDGVVELEVFFGVDVLGARGGGLIASSTIAWILA